MIQTNIMAVTHIVTMVFEDAENGVRVRTGLMPGDVDYITYLHGVVYDEEYSLDTTFEAYVAKPLAEFALDQDNPRQRIWVM